MVLSKTLLVARALPAIVPLMTLGCQPRWAGAPRVPNPVLLGPVDRVGGHRAAGGSLVGAVDDRVGSFVAVSTSEYRYGGRIFRRADVYARIDGSAKWSPAILETTKGARNVDVRADGVDLGGYLLFSPWSGASDTWIRLRGDAVRLSDAP